MSLNGDSFRAAANSVFLLGTARLLQIVGVPLACVLLTIYLTNASAERKDVKTTLDTINITLAHLQDKTDNIYTKDDAAGDFKWRDERMTNLGSRITDLGGRIDGNTHRIETLEAWRGRYPHR